MKDRNVYHTADCGILPESERLDVDAVVREMLILFPSARVLSEDLYESERLHLLETFEALAAKGTPIKHEEIMLNDIENRRAFFGVAKQLLLPTALGNVKVYVKERELRFFTEVDFDEDTAIKIRLLFKELNLAVTFYGD